MGLPPVEIQTGCLVSRIVGLLISWGELKFEAENVRGRKMWTYCEER